MAFPGVDASRSPATRSSDDVDAADHHGVRRPGAHRRQRARRPLHRSTSITIRATPATATINWFDESAAACGEMVFDLIDALGVPLTLEIATHIYLAILTDTGSFHYSNISPRTFDICRADASRPASIRRAWRGSVYDSNSIGRLKLFGAVLSAMQLDRRGRLAVVYLNDEMAHATGGTYERHRRADQPAADGEEIQAVVFFKLGADGDIRVSMRSKGDVDVGAVAKEFGGGGHKNAAGCTVRGPLDAIRDGVRAGADGRDRRRHADRRPLSSNSHGRRARRRQAGRPDVARRRRARAPRARRAAHRPHRHARSAGDRRLLVLLVGRATRLAQFLVGDDKEYHARRPSRASRPTPTTPRGSMPSTPMRNDRPALPARDAIDAALDRVPRHVPADAAAVLGEEGRRAAVRTSSRARRRAASSCSPSRSTVSRSSRCISTFGAIAAAPSACARVLHRRLLRAVARARPRAARSGCGAHLARAAADAGGEFSRRRGDHARRRSRRGSGAAAARDWSHWTRCCRTCRRSG